MIKELMSFAKCEIGKCLVNYFKVIHCSRHVLWQYWLHIFVYYITRRISSREKRRTNNWSSIPHLNRYLEIYLRHANEFIYINIKKSYKCEVMEDMERYVNYDGGWKMINKNLTMMNHASEKCKRKVWHHGIICDGEGQVDIWIWGINQVMKSHIALSVDIYWIK
jgi:hypothetical protein